MPVREDILARIKRSIKGGYTLAEVKEMWAEQHYPGLSKGGINGYEIAYSQCEEYHDWPFKKIKYKQWQDCINKLRIAGLHYSSQKKLKNFIGQVCDFAIKNEWAEYNYAKMLRLDRNRPVIIKRPFTEAEIRKLWRYVGRVANVDLVLMLIYTGVRISEFMHVINKRDVFIDDRYFIVRESKTEAGRNRMVPLHLDIVPFVRKRLKYEKLSCTKNGDIVDTYSRFHKLFEEVMDAMGFDHSIHETRHTLATLLDAANANDMATKRILGHAGVGITKAVYVHKYLSDLINAIDLVKGKDI